MLFRINNKRVVTCKYFTCPSQGSQSLKSTKISIRTRAIEASQHAKYFWFCVVSGMVWCGMVWHGMVWCLPWHDAEYYNSVWRWSKSSTFNRHQVDTWGERFTFSRKWSFERMSERDGETDSREEKYWTEWTSYTRLVNLIFGEMFCVCLGFVLGKRLWFGRHIDSNV